MQPPISVHEELVAIRLHIDECDERNARFRRLTGAMAIKPRLLHLVTSNPVTNCDRMGVLILFLYPDS
jgi:hypothetical protein